MFKKLKVIGVMPENYKVRILHCDLCGGPTTHDFLHAKRIEQIGVVNMFVCRECDEGVTRPRIYGVLRRVNNQYPGLLGEIH